jgi:xanthine dehydrogenase small subunit
MRDHIEFFLNGQAHSVRGDEAFAPLTEFIRDRLGLTGTKVVCAEGDCGACAVLVGRPENERLRYAPVDACLLFLYQLDGAHVITVEGLSPHGECDSIQKALVDHHGSQCGYCTPGFVMALAGWREAGMSSGRSAVCVALTGNLCRCTGYLAILEAAATVAAASDIAPSSHFQDAEVEQKLRAIHQDAIRVQVGERIFFAPSTLADAVTFKASFPQSVIVSGGTELGVLRNKKGYNPAVLLSLARVPGLDAVKRDGAVLHIGANATWTQVGHVVRDLFPEFHRLIERFGGPQIRNVATLVGNVAHGSPIADSLGLLTIMDATLTIVGPRATRRRSINGFYQGYKKKDLAADELILGVELPLPADDEHLRLYKISRRRDLDIATFGAGVRVREELGVITQASIAYSGVGPTVVRLSRTESCLIGRPFDETSFRQAGLIARSEIEPISDVRGSADFRWQLAENILTKFYFDELECQVQR